MSKTHVADWQRTLNSVLPANLDEDGIFGPATSNASFKLLREFDKYAAEKSPAVAPKPAPVADEARDKWPKLAIVVGHNERGQGAVRADTNESEYRYNNQIAELMRGMAAEYEIDAKVFNRKPAGGYSREIRTVYGEADTWGADATIELHFNAASAAATGTETLSSGTSGSMTLAKEVQEEMLGALGLRNRGIKVRNRKNRQRGYLSLVTGKAPAILVEPFFNENPNDLSKTKTDKQRKNLARALLKGADAYFDAA